MYTLDINFLSDRMQVPRQRKPQSNGVVRLPLRFTEVDPTFDKQKVAADTLGAAFKSSVRDSDFLSSITIQGNTLLDKTGNEPSISEFRENIAKIGDEVLSSSGLTQKLIEIAINPDIPHVYSEVAKESLDKVFVKAKASNNDNLFAVLLNGYQDSSHQHQIQTAFDLIDKLNLRSLSINQALDDFHVKMQAYGESGKAFSVYGSSLIRLALDRNIEMERLLLAGRKLEDSLVADPTLANQARKTYGKIIQKAADESTVDPTKQNSDVTNYAAKFQKILVDLVTYPESSTEYKQAVTSFRDNIEKFSEEQTLSSMKQEALQEKIATLKSSHYISNEDASRLEERFRANLNTEYEVYKHRDENFTNALLHVREVLAKIEYVSSVNSAIPSSGLSVKILDSLLLNINLESLGEKDELVNPLQETLTGKRFTDNSERLRREFRNFYETSINAEIRQSLSGITPISNEASLDITNPAVLSSLKEAISLPIYRNNSAALALLTNLNNPNANVDNTLYKLYDFLLIEKQKNISSLLPEINLNTSGDTYNLNEKTITDLEVLRDLHKFKENLNQSGAEINEDVLSERYGQMLSKNLSDSLMMVCRTEDEASLNPVITRCEDVVNHYQAKTDASYQSGTEFFVNFIQKFLQNIQDVLNIGKGA
jgi:hypothetical protein